MISGAPAHIEADQKGVRACQSEAFTIATHVIPQTVGTGALCCDQPGEHAWERNHRGAQTTEPAKRSDTYLVSRAVLLWNGPELIFTAPELMVAAPRPIATYPTVF